MHPGMSLGLVYSLNVSCCLFFPSCTHRTKEKLGAEGSLEVIWSMYFSLPYTSHSTCWKRSKEVNEFGCSVNFGLDAFGRGGLSTVLSFVIPTYVNVGK